jgi:hypothetical protein
LFENLKGLQKQIKKRRRKKIYFFFQFPYMECSSGRSGDGDSGPKEDKRSEHSIGDDHEDNKKETIVEVKINSILSYLVIKNHFSFYIHESISLFWFMLIRFGGQN